MTVIREQAECETLWMETTFCKEHRYNEQIMIAYSGGNKPDVEPYLSIVLYGANKGDYTPPRMWAQIFPNMEEVDIIIKALQEAKAKALVESETIQ